MESKVVDGRLVIQVAGRINANNAKELEEELDRIVAAHAGFPVVLDAGELEYISSAGLRVMLKLRKQLGGLTVVETSPEVYEVFEVTGFTELFDVNRRMRHVSIEGCECIGKGGNGAVYRLDAETIVKVYYGSTETLEKIQESRRSAQKLMAYGIPVAIAFDVVRVGEDYGLVYELLDCKTIGELIHDDPTTAERWAHEASEILKLLHTTEVPEGTFPDARDSGHRWVEVAKDVLTEDQRARLHRIYDTMPVKNTLVHGDYHAGNIMVQNGEIVLIDTDDVAQGDPIIDLAGMSVTFEGITTDSMSLEVIGMTVDEKDRYFDAFLRDYYGTDDEAVLQGYAYQRKVHSLIKMLYGMCKTDKLPQEVKDQYIPGIREGLMQLLDAMGM